MVAAVRAPAQAGHAVGALRLMAAAGLAPSVAAHAALGRMGRRLHDAAHEEQQAADERRSTRLLRILRAAPGTSSPPVRGAARFWTPEVLPVHQWIEALQAESAGEGDGGDAAPCKEVGAAAAQRILEVSARAPPPTPHALDPAPAAAAVRAPSPSAAPAPPGTHERAPRAHRGHHARRRTTRRE